MSLANKEALKAFDLKEIPIGAVLVDNNTKSVISKAHNEVIKDNNSIKHAEIILINKACKKINSRYLQDTSIFVTLEPCAMCAAAINEARITTLYFGAYDDKKGALESKKIYDKYFSPQIYGGINEVQCSTILKKFFLKKRVSVGK
tara:strand:- start:478 stop:915 length:438 start_codon:yes stop_codon:yes gene_type:complete